MKKLLLISIFLIAILSLTAVSAETNTTNQMEITDSPSSDEIVTVDDNADVLDENDAKIDWDMDISYPDELIQNIYDLDPEGISIRNYNEINGSNIHTYVDGIYNYDISSNKKIVINPDNYTLGRHNFTFVFDGNDYYNPVNKTVAIDIVYFNFEISDYLAKKGSMNQLTILASRDATGTVEVYLNGEFYKSDKLSYQNVLAPDYDSYDENYNEEEIKIYSGCNIYLYRLEYKTYEIEVRYSGNEKYAPVTKKENITFKYNIGTTLNEVYTINNRENITFNIILPQDITENVFVTIDGKKYGTEFKKNNYGTVYFEVVFDNITIGQHNLTAGYPGDEDYPAYSINKTFKLIVAPNYNSNYKINTENSITLQMPSDAVGNFSVYLAKLKDDDVSYENLTLVESVNLVNGFGKIELMFSKPDSYYMLMKYDTNYGSEEFDTWVNVLTSVELNPSYLNMFYKDNGRLYVTVKDSIKGTPVKGLAVTAKIGKTTLKSTTNSEGKVSFKIPANLAPGDYSIKIKCNDTTQVVKGTVKHILTLKTVKIKKSSKLVLQATLKNKKPLKNKKITFKFNGRTFTAKTNSKGIAKVTIPKSIMKKLKVGKKRTYQASYGKDVVKKTVKVLK